MAPTQQIILLMMEDTLTLKGPANASGKLNFNSGTISITSITDNVDQITGEVNTAVRN